MADKNDDVLQDLLDPKKLLEQLRECETKQFKNAIDLGLNMSADLAMAKLNLAGIAMTKGRKREAEILLAEAKKLDKHNMMDEQIKMMKQQMKRAGMPKQHHGQRSARAGRKSRR